ncbi:hypothetical protein [Nonomuraea sp. NPDC048916]|uniref:hypothetical protein n=1 Tax=Nonomuraea sp. NPDC048916 TaxID=3154232 RepID=UPI0033DCF69B
MPHGDDLDARFNALVSQIGDDERRRMRASATKGARPLRAPRPARGPRSRRAVRGLLAVAATIAVVSAAGLVVAFRPDVLTAIQQAAGPVSEETLPVISAPWAAGPFDGSPAETYADGIAGFVMPPAKALGGLPEQDVAKALKRTRELLAAAYLDRATLMGGEPAAFVKLLDPTQRALFRENLDRRTKDGFDSRGWVAGFAPRTAELSTDVIKVRGTTTLARLEEDGRTGVKVQTNYLVVYAVNRPGRPATTIRVVVHSKGELFAYREGGRLVLWVRDLGHSSTPARCDVKDAFIHPVYRDSGYDSTAPSGPPSDPYDLDDEPESKSGCSASKGT